MGSPSWPIHSASTSDFTGYTISHPPGVSEGTLSQLRQEGQQWLGPRLSHDTPAEDRVTREKSAAGPRGIILPWFLPYVDNYTQETAAMRVAYRQMLADPNVKSALLGKLLAVAALDLKVQPYRKNDPEAKAVADFVHWNLTERLTDGIPGLIWSILSGGLIDGYSVCEKVWGYEEKGPHAGKVVLKDVKPKDTLNDVVLLTDPFRNVVGVQGLRYNAGQIFPPSDFILWRHLPLFGSPVGTSDFRAAYSRYWMLDTVLKIRAMGLEKRSLPVLLGHYDDPALQPTLADHLAKAKSQTWITVPSGAKVEALNIAGMADAQFGEAIKDLKHDIFLGIQGAILQALEGETKEGAGNSQVHRSTADLWVWFLSQTVQATFNNRDNGLVRDMVDLNYVTPDYPKSTLSAVDSNELVQEMQIDTGLKGLGLDLSKEEAYERYSRSAPKDEADALKGTQPPAPGGEPAPGGMPEMPFVERFADEPDPWQAYQGHRGGKGWKNNKTGRIIYGATKPSARGKKESKADPKSGNPQEQIHDVASGKKEINSDAVAGQVALIAQHMRIWEVHDLASKMGLEVGPKESKTGMLARIESALQSKATKRKDAPKRVAVVSTEDLHVDPARFQYKLNVSGPAGVGDEFKGVRQFNPDLAGVLAVWKDPADGKDYVVNGHHRHEMASRLGHPDMLVRYLEAKDAKEARAKGALINIAEGRGTAVDAAKFMRDAGVSIEDMSKAGISLSGKIAADAGALNNLNDRLFDRMTRGLIDEGKAIAVAKHLPDHEMQDTLFRLLDKREQQGKETPPKLVEEMAREMAQTPKHTKTEESLFGTIESEESLFVERNELKAHVRTEMSKEVADFLAVSSKRRAERVAGAGNSLNPEENKKIAQEAGRVLATFDTLVNRKGAISDAINEAAGKYAKAKTRKERDAIKQQAMDAVKGAVFEEAGVGAGGLGKAA